jgi:hypothetical protein
MTNLSHIQSVIIRTILQRALENAREQAQLAVFSGFVEGWCEHFAFADLLQTAAHYADEESKGRPIEIAYNWASIADLMEMAACDAKELTPMGVFPSSECTEKPDT